MKSGEHGYTLMVFVLIAIFLSFLVAGTNTGLFIDKGRAVQEDNTAPEPFVEITAPETTSEPVAEEEQPVEPEEPIIPPENGTNEALPGVLNFGTMSTVGACADIVGAGYYVLTTDLADNQSNGVCIYIKSDDVILNCSIYNLTSSLPADTPGQYTYGVFVSGQDNVTITDCDIYNYTMGIDLTNSGAISVTKNYLAANYMGITVYGTNSSNFTGNTMNSNDNGMFLFGSINNLVVNNTANSNSLSGFLMDIVDYSTFINNTASLNTGGLSLNGTKYCTFTGNNFTENTNTGIGAQYYSDHNTFSSNTINSTTASSGVVLSYNSTNNSFTNDSVNMTSPYYNFYTDNGTLTVVNNMLIGDVRSSFFMGDDAFLMITQATAPAGGDPAGYTNIGKYLNITNETAGSWIYINVSYDDGDLSPLAINNTTIKIFKNVSGGWTSDIGTPNTIDETHKIVYANISTFGSIFAPMGEPLDVSGCQNLTTANNVYVLTQNLVGNLSGGACINITANNVTLDCAGKSITGNEPGMNHFGVYVNGYNDTTIINCIITNYSSGVFIYSSSNSSIANNSVYSNTEGIRLIGSPNGSIINNSVYQSYNGIDIDTDSSNTLIVNNSVYSSEQAGILVSSSSNNTITNNLAYNNSQYGIAVQLYSANNTLADNSVYNNSQHGIVFYLATNNHLTNNSAYNNSQYGIAFESGSDNNTLTNNNASFNTVWDFYSTDSLGNNITNLTTNNTISSFTYSGNISLKSSDGSGRPDLAEYQNIGRYLNITNGSAAAWIYLNISYTDAGIILVNESSLRIFKNASGNWSQSLNLTGTLTSGVNETANYVYANISNFSSVFAPMGEKLPTAFYLINVNDTNHNITAKYSANIMNADGLSYCAIEHNNTGSFANTSFTALSGTSVWCNITIINNNSNNTNITWYVWANDSTETWARSDAQSFLTTNTAPVLTSASSNVTNITEGTAVGLLSSGADDGNADSLRLECGYSNGAVDACAGTYGSGERTCTLAWPYEDNNNHTLYCRVNDSYGVSTPDFEFNITGYASYFRIVLVSPLNDSYHNNASLWFNISTTKNASACLVSIDGNANATMGNSTPTAWYNYTTGLSGSSHNVSFWCNKSYSPDENDSKTAYFTVDLTAPVINITLPAGGSTSTTEDVAMHATVNEPASTCRVETDGDDNTTMTNSSGDWHETIELPNGAHSVKVYCSDLAGNWNASGTVAFTVAVPATTGGGTSGGGISGDTVIFTFTNIPLNVYSSSSSSNPAIDITKIVIKPKQTLTGQVSVKQLTQKPTEVTEPSNKTSRYFLFTSTNIPYTLIVDAEVHFRVLKSWVTQNNVDLSSIKLYRNSNGWQTLSTESNGSDSTYYYFKASTTGFSYFAISGKAVSAAPAQNQTVTPIIVPVPIAICGDGVCDTSETSIDCQADCPGPTAEERETGINILVIFGLSAFALVAAAVVVFLLVIRPRLLKPAETMPAVEVNILPEKEHMLEAYIRKTVSQGHSQQEIVNALLGAGWTEEQIEAAFELAMVPPQKEEALIEYVQRQFTRGFTEEQITQKMTGVGWSLKEARHSIKIAQKGFEKS
ncbi:MAG: right-handed parallel beta-helix repeat-containing protein [Candidatus Nanoarchaeia archaeon]|nr:right-handed parallel beta-helix repeat-containing protein [Candidatus Nanoarchaeia archaeon]MDD5239460.1 right-handed parallel beta-helix repeat-containing protein [Candidatus Nanoarchaeia archaeon]